MLVSSARKPTRFRWIALAFFVLLAIGLGLALVVHERYVAFDAVAAKHLPKDANVLARFDLTHVMFYEPFRRSLAPLASRLPEDAASEGRERRLDARDVRVAGDIREVAIAFGPEPGGWTVAFGGRLPKSGLDRTLAEVLRGEGRELTEAGGLFLAPSPGFAFAQAEDGALVLASSAERLRAVLPPQASPRELTEGSGGFVLSGPALPAPMQLARGSFRAGSVVVVDSHIVFQAGSSKVARNQAFSAVFAGLGGGDPAVGAAFERAERSESGDTERASIRIPREAILALANRAAAVILGH